MTTITIKIFKGIPLSREHTMFFNSVNEQDAFFNRFDFLEIKLSNFQRRKGVINAPFNADKLNGYNYVCFPFGNLNIYAYIDNITYINDISSEITFTIDNVQTYLFDMVLNPCFVEREIVEDDTIGLHTIEEGLNFGETLRKSFATYQPTTFLLEIYVTEVTQDVREFSDIGKVRITTPKFLNSTIPVYFILQFISSDILTDLLKSYEGIPESVITIFLKPNFEGAGYIENNSKGYQLSTPKNNKLRVYPYSYTVVDCGTTSKIYHNELLTDNRFYVDISDLQDIPTHIYPVEYNGLNKNLTDSLFLETNGYKIPWKGSALQSWLNQNIGNIAISTIGGVAGVVGGLATGNLLMAGGGVASIGNILGQGFTQAKRPDSVQGNFVPVASIYYGVCKAIFYNSYLKSEYLKIIDDYFSAYGYKVNTIKIPSLKNRPNWTFIKTNKSNVTGDIPIEAKEDIDNIFNTGVTFWVNDLGNYERGNK